jgi:non-ribosomal peptide synthetase component F/NAD(P)-dependent dehydrogenase (short-subunit alcohol dehydrogenase family)/acyl carrier protein
MISTSDKQELLKLILAKKGIRLDSQLIRSRGPLNRAELSFAQARLWFIHELDPSSPAYNMCWDSRMKGGLRVDVLEAVINEIIRRHEILRTTYESSGTGPLQIIHEYVWRELPVIDLAELAAERTRHEARLLVKEEAQRPFSLRKGPIVRTSLLRLASDDHVILYTLNHIAADGWSIGVLNREIEALYQAFSRGERSPLPELPVQYADFAVWQRGWLHGEMLTSQLDYWRTQLAGLTPLALLTDFPRPAIQTFRGGQSGITIPANITAGLKGVSQREGTTLFMTLLAAVQFLLSRYSGREDIALGTPIANRNHPEIENLIGFFVNTLVFRTNLAGNPTITELLRRVKEVTLGALGHQDLPFEKLVEELHPDRDLGRNPLFQTLFALQNAPDEGVALAGVALQQMGVTEIRTRFDLELHFHDARQTINCIAIYNKELFKAETIGQMMMHLERVLQCFAADAGQRLWELSLLNSEEQEEGLNGGVSIFHDNEIRLLHELVEEQAAKCPGAVAVEAGDCRLTYQELNAKAGRVAHYLTNLGAGPRMRIGVCLDRSPELIIALLGILKAGGSYVALEPVCPPDLLARVLAHADISVVLTRESMQRVLLNTKARIVFIDRDVNTMAEPGVDENPGYRPEVEDEAYLAYSSRPLRHFNASSVPHRSVTQWLQNATAIGLNPEDRVAQVSSLWSGVATFEIWGALSRGARVIVIRDEDVTAPCKFAERLGEKGITALFLTADHFRRMARSNPCFCHSLRLVLFGLGSVGTKQAGEVLRHSVPAKLVQVYDPMGTGLFALGYFVDAEIDQMVNIPLGRPLAHVRAHILDKVGNPVPAGIPGELCLEDAKVRGWIQQPHLTAEKLIPNPFNGRNGERLYRTSFPARFLANGNIELLEPVKQCFVNGFPVELEEWRLVFLEDATVEECFLSCRETETGGSELVAYLVCRDGFQLDRFRERVDKQWPCQWMPSAYVVVSSLPRTASGGVDEAALQRLEVVDAALVGRWEDRLRALPELKDFAVFVQKRKIEIPPLHLTDLLPMRAVEPGTSEPVVRTVSPAEEETPEENRTMALSSGGELRVPPEAPCTLGEALMRTAQAHPTRGVFYLQSPEEEDFQSYESLLADAKIILAGLQTRGLQPGHRVIFQIESFRDHFTTFWACMLGGIVPVTVAVPVAYRERTGVINKLQSTWELLGHPIVLTNESLVDALRGLKSLPGVGPFDVLAVEELRNATLLPVVYQSKPTDTAFLQLSSGSTGIPKCIQITHKGIVAHIHGSAQFNCYQADDVSLNWLALDHVVPILTYHIKDVYLGCRQIHVKTAVILADPLKWLDLLEKHRATHAWSPNFGFKLVSDRLGRSLGRTWNLSSIKYLMNAGEQVTLPVVEEFLKAVAGFGIPPRAMQPAFGMAEVCTCMTYQNHFDLERAVHRVLKSSLGGVLQKANGKKSGTVAFVDLGPPIPGVDIRIVDHNNTLVSEGVVGQLQIRGDVVTPGYLNNAASNLEAFVGDTWFNSGDRGFILNGRLTLTGREKEMIIIRGANYYCYEIEDVVSQVDGIEPTFAAAGAVSDPRTGSEGLAIFFVPKAAATGVELIQEIRSRVAAELGISALYVIPLAKKDFPKTTSGKIQRKQLMQLLAAGAFEFEIKKIDIQLKNERTIPDWFYEETWQPRQSGNTRGLSPHNCLLMADSLGLGNLLAAKLAADGCNCVIVEKGADFLEQNTGHYCINVQAPDDYRKLLALMAARGFEIDRVIHLWTYDESMGEAANMEALRESQYRGVYSLLFLVQALAQYHDEKRPVKLEVISSHTQPVCSGDKIACEKATMVGLLKTIPLEMAWLHCAHIDFAGGPLESNARCILHELCLPQREAAVAYRRSRRFVPIISKIDMLREDACETSLSHDGIFLLTGGLGGIGAHLAEWLIKHYKIKLLIIGRTVLPPVSEWRALAQGETALGQRIQNYLKIQACDGDFMYQPVDVCDRAGLQKVIAAAEAKWGRSLSGVIHLAGEANLEEQWQNAPKHLITTEDLRVFEETFRAKVYGTWAISQLVKNNPGALFILFSSVSSVFGGAAFSAYSGANRFIDYYADAQPGGPGPKTYCFNWSMWDGIGMSQRITGTARAAIHGLGYQIISLESGMHSLIAGLSRKKRRLIIGLNGESYSIQRRVQSEPSSAYTLIIYFTGYNPIPISRLQELEVQDRFKTPSFCSFVQLRELPRNANGEIDREKLSLTASGPGSSETAPRNETEFMIARIWRELMRLDHVGLHENFFSLGGHSLLATQVVSKVREDLGVELPLRSLFEAPTVARLAELVETLRWASPDREARRGGNRQEGVL